MFDRTHGSGAPPHAADVIDPRWIWLPLTEMAIIALLRSMHAHSRFRFPLHIAELLASANAFPLASWMRTPLLSTITRNVSSIQATVSSTPSPSSTTFLASI